MIPLIGILLAALLALGKGANILVDQAVKLSVRLRAPPMLIGATVVSLGTTLPEAAVSVLAAVQGDPELALGNAVGSIICDTGLILGVGALIRPLPLDRRMIHSQGLIQVGSAALLVVLSLPHSSLGTLGRDGGALPQWAGLFFLFLLAGYIWWTLRFAGAVVGGEAVEDAVAGEHGGKVWPALGKLFFGIAIVVLSSKAVIPSAQIVASRAGVPPGVIAASLVALGTSLPELVTVITSVLKGRGDLAVGNVMGADILNVLFVAGLSAAVTPGGLDAQPVFFFKLFPFMLFILLVFRLAASLSRGHLGRLSGGVLVGLYMVFLWFNYLE